MVHNTVRRLAGLLSPNHSHLNTMQLLTDHQATQQATTALEREFWEFHNKNPHVYKALVRLARQWCAARPHSALGIACLYERMRWEMAITTTDPNFKLNNNYKAYYARLMMSNERDLDGLFKLRALACEQGADQEEAVSEEEGEL